MIVMLSSKQPYSLTLRQGIIHGTVVPVKSSRRLLHDRFWLTVETRERKTVGKWGDDVTNHFRIADSSMHIKHTLGLRWFYRGKNNLQAIENCRHSGR